MKTEYKVVKRLNPPLGREDLLENTLNTYSSYGWEVVSVLRTNEDTLFIFKRMV